MRNLYVDEQSYIEIHEDSITINCNLHQVLAEVGLFHVCGKKGIFIYIRSASNTNVVDRLTTDDVYGDMFNYGYASNGDKLQEYPSESTKWSWTIWLFLLRMLPMNRCLALVGIF